MIFELYVSSHNTLKELLYTGSSFPLWLHCSDIIKMWRHLQVGKDRHSLLQLFHKAESVDSSLQNDTGCIELESGNYFCKKNLQCEFCIVNSGSVLHLSDACGWNWNNTRKMMIFLNGIKTSMIRRRSCTVTLLCLWYRRQKLTHHGRHPVLEGNLLPL